MNPANGSTADATRIKLSLSFHQPIDFAGTVSKGIYLYDVSDESKPIWQADPDPAHVAQGKLTVVFDDIPNLIPNGHYAIRWDAGWIKVGKRPVGTLNDGAYWWRFRTPINSQTK
jgi:arylsulfatase